MDELKKKLKADADAIEATVSPALQARLDASLRSAEMLRDVPPPPQPASSFAWASSLTGIAVAMLVIVLINWNKNPEEIVSPETIAVTPLPSEQLLQPVRFPLNAKTADLTAPLQEELRNLQSDLQKARDNVAEDIRSSF
jgi:hypothetical protein